MIIPTVGFRLNSSVLPLAAFFLVILTFNPSGTANSSSQIPPGLAREVPSCPTVFSIQPLEQAWAEALEAVRYLLLRTDNPSVIRALLTAVIAGEHIMIDGPPGSGKTAFSRQVLKMILAALNREQTSKSREIFTLQFHQLTSETRLRGMPNVRDWVDKNDFKIERANSLADERFVFFLADEVDKANPAVLETLLSMLNERMVFDGTELVALQLNSAVFTSNKTAAEFLKSFGENLPAGEALLDRIAIKVLMLNQVGRGALGSRLRAYREQLFQQAQLNPPFLPLLRLRALLDELKIKPEVIPVMSQLIFDVENSQTQKLNQNRSAQRAKDPVPPYFPDNQLSNRSDEKAPKMLLASFLIEQLLNLTPYSDLRREVGIEDLHLLSFYFFKHAPGWVDHKPEQVKVLSSQKVRVSAPDPFDLSKKRSVNQSEFVLVPEIQYNPYSQTFEGKLKAQGPDPFFGEVEIRFRGRAILRYHPDGSLDEGRSRIELIWSELPILLSPSGAEHYFAYTGNYFSSTGGNEKKGPASVLSAGLMQKLRDSAIADARKVELALLRSLAAAQDSWKNRNPEFVVTDGLTEDLREGVFDPRVRAEIERIQETLIEFAGSLNGLIPAAKSEEKKLAREARKLVNEVKAEALEIQERLSALQKKIESRGPELSEKDCYEMTQAVFQALVKMFPEAEETILSIFESILNGSHVYLFGPPGGAKTYIANQIFRAVLRSLNRINSFQVQTQEFAQKILEKLKMQKGTQYVSYLLQFHKLMSESQITGFARLGSQLEGRPEYDYSKSLAGERVLFAVLDEVEKGTPAVMVALLSLLNERQVFQGNEVVTSLLRSAVLNSNKIPAEVVEAFGNDETSADALFARALHKVYQHNKFSSVTQLTKFLMQVVFGKRPQLEVDLPLLGLLPIVERTEIGEAALTGRSQVLHGVASRALAREVQQRNAQREDGVNNPFYQLSAFRFDQRGQDAQKGLWKVAYLMQLMRGGRSYEELGGLDQSGLVQPMIRVRIAGETGAPFYPFEALMSLARGAIYTGPFRLHQVARNGTGLVEIDVDPESPGLKLLQLGPSLDDRLRFVLENIRDEHEALVRDLNTVVSRIVEMNLSLAVRTGIENGAIDRLRSVFFVGNDAYKDALEEARQRLRSESPAGEKSSP